MTSTEESSRAAIEVAWNTLEASWDDEAAHRRFIAFCSARGSLAEAGARYRAVAETDPARRERAKRQVGAVMAAALVLLERSRAPTKVGRSRLWWVLCGALLVICGYGILSVLRRVARRS
ncbi:MAG TPA: hypothetical protein VI299_05425 [Polyangiales bacterium]